MHICLLQVLNLSDNRISALDGLPGLPRLIDLNLAGNPMRTIGLHLLKCPQLSILNLAATQIGCFDTLWQLSLLDKLQNLALEDSTWGAAPIVGLSNYRCYALCQLPGLLLLDHVNIDEVSYYSWTVPPSLHLPPPPLSARPCSWCFSMFDVFSLLPVWLRINNSATLFQSSTA